MGSKRVEPETIESAGPDNDLELAVQFTNGFRVTSSSSSSLAIISSLRPKRSNQTSEQPMRQQRRPSESPQEWCRRHCRTMKSNIFLVAVSTVIFFVLAGAGIAIACVFANASADQERNDAIEMARDTGAWFSNQLDYAILPIFSLAQFATELEMFRVLPDKIGPAFANGSLPFLPPDQPGMPVTHRNVTGVCDQPALVSRFNEIASNIKRHANMEGILVNIQLAPEGVVCLLYPLNNTQDFPPGVFMDNTGALGLDLFADPEMKFLAESTITQEKVVVAGPLKLRQCQQCNARVEKAFIARLPIDLPSHNIYVDGVAYHRYGFATALINWEQLVVRSGIYETFAVRGFQFQLTRTDRIFNATTNSYTEQVVVLAETPNFQLAKEAVTTALQTTNNEWVMTVVYGNSSDHAKIWGIITAIVLSICIAFLVYTVLVQKQFQMHLLGTALAQEAKVETERNMTAYFAHELRNPLCAIDSALCAMPDDMPEQAKELVTGMQLCSQFMSSIMNNLLDVRKLEEGKMTLDAHPMSLQQLLRSVYQMLLPSVKSGVEFRAICNTQNRDWVLADFHRLQQVLTNVITNAIKYTNSGSIVLTMEWNGDNVKFDCTDTGPGIPKNEQEHLFERYVQRGGAPGTGLGLAIAKQIVENMSGSIHFESDPTIKPGTSCIVVLPLPTCEEPDSLQNSGHFDDPILEPLRLLIVDDIKMNRMMLQRRIRKSIAPNCVILEAETGEGALMICETEHFDVIVVDQYMDEGGGVMVGTDVVIALRRMKVDSIIVGYSGNELEQSFLDAGANLFWQKPIPNNSTIIRQLRAGLAAERRAGE